MPIPRSLKLFYRKVQPSVIWFLGAASFFVEYFARVDPSIMVPQLMTAFQVGAFALGRLSAYFYVPYILMQIPVGTLVDRYGPRRLLALAAFICGGGCYLFSWADQLWVAELSRLLMGFSAAFAFICTLKLATIWFHSRHLGLLSGLTQGFGMLGAAVGESLFSYIAERVGWRQSLASIGMVLIILSVLIWLIVRDRSSGLLNRPVPDATKVSVWESLKIVFRNVQTWRIALFAGFVYAPTGVFAELWGPSFLHKVYGVTPELSAIAVSVVFIGLAIGGASIGWLSDKIGLRRPILIASALIGLILISIVIYVPHLPFVVLFILLFLYGVSNMGVALSYAVASELNPRPVAGLSIAFTNMGSILIAAILQPVIGWLLRFHWKGVYLDGHPFYSADNYKSAMVILPISLLVALIIAFSIKETHCEAR